MQHPSDEILIAFTEGRLGEDQLDDVAGHLEQCRDCEQRVEQIEEDEASILVRLRRGQGTVGRLPEGCEEKLLAAGRLGGTGPVEPAASTPDQRLDPEAKTVSYTGSVDETSTDRGPVPPTGAATPEVHTTGAFASGDVFGDYEIVEEIARGGMGVVYRARQISLNRPVAVKMILDSRLASEQAVRRFRTEAEAAARLNHPDIVPVYEIGENGGQHFFSMGFVPGGSLKDLLADGPLPPRQAAQLVRRVARTVQFAHSRNIVHRDLKPANVLLDEHGNPKLTDFGLAKDVESNAQLTSDGQVMGTPSYMAPEQAAGRLEEVGPLSDVYSLGAILYYLLADRPPFAEESVVDTLQAVLHDEPASPRSFNADVDLDLATVCLKCLEKDPAARYPSAAELADDLDRYLRGAPIDARPISRRERFVRWCRRNPGPVWGVLVTILIMAGAVVYAALGLERELRSFETTLDDVAQRSVEDTARWVASAAERELREKFRHVQTAAGTPALRQRLAELVRDESRYEQARSELAAWDAAAGDVDARDRPPLPQALRDLQSWISGGRPGNDEHFGPPLWEYDPDEVTESVLAWWVCGPDGWQIARDPWKSSKVRDFGFRSYFTGRETDAEQGTHPDPVWQPGDGPRMSAVFRTRETNYWVLAISAPVWGEDGDLLGVVGIFLRLGSLLERPEDDAAERTARYAVLLDPRPDGDVARIVEHPYYHRPSAMRDGHLREEVGRTTITRAEWQAPLTRDPFGGAGFGAEGEFGGRWRNASATVRIPDDSGNRLIALVRESEGLVSDPSHRLRTNLRWLGLAVAGLFVLPVIPLLLLLPDRRRRSGNRRAKET